MSGSDPDASDSYGVIVLGAGAGGMAAAIVAMVLVQPAAAQDADPDRWGLTVAPYFVFPNMSGQTGIGDVTIDVDADPGDIFDKLQFGFMIFLEMSNEDWAVGVGRN